MTTYSANLARLRVAVETGVLPPDLGRWALREIEPAERYAERNELLRQAADRVSGSRWAKARRLEREVRALRAHPALRERAVDDGVRVLVAAALRSAPCQRPPESIRQLFRILED